MCQFAITALYDFFFQLELFSPDLKEKPQVVAYNKIDVPDSGDYFDFVREELLSEGVPVENIFAISAATGQGVLDLVRKVRQVVDDLGPPEQIYETNAVNQTKMPGRQNERMDDFTIDVEEPNGPDKPRVFYVNGKALEKFAQVTGSHPCFFFHSLMLKRTSDLLRPLLFHQMTNWDYYEAVKRFQKVLDAAGINSALRARGVRERDTVVIYESEFEWQDDQSDAALYQAFKDDMRSRGRTVQGVAAWPKGAKDSE